MYKIFKEYVLSNYDINNPDIKRKYIHSIKTAALSKEIAESLNLSSKDIQLAELIGLFHDIGRFYEVKNYGKMTIKNNFDHGLYALKILYEDELFDKLNILSSDRPVISFAIRNHDKLFIEETDNQKYLLHAKIIRDADKMDIYRVLTSYKSVLDEPFISPLVMKDVLRLRSVDHQNVKSSTDQAASRIAFLFDFNFKVSLDILASLGYFNKYLNSLEGEEKLVNKIKNLAYSILYYLKEVKHAGEKV